MYLPFFQTCGNNPTPNATLLFLAPLAIYFSTPHTNAAVYDSRTGPKLESSFLHVDDLPLNTHICNKRVPHIGT